MGWVGGNSNGEHRNMYRVFRRVVGCRAESCEFPWLGIGGMSWKQDKEAGIELLKRFARAPQLGKHHFLELLLT